MGLPKVSPRASSAVTKQVRLMHLTAGTRQSGRSTLVICLQLFAQGERPILAIKGLRVGDFNGKTLSSISQTSIRINPNDLPEAAQLRQWCDHFFANQALILLHSLFSWLLVESTRCGSHLDSLLTGTIITCWDDKTTGFGAMSTDAKHSIDL